jgi:hypothetical protein
MFFSRDGHLNRPIRRLISNVLWGWRSFLTHVTEIVGSDAQRSPKATVKLPNEKRGTDPARGRAQSRTIQQGRGKLLPFWRCLGIIPIEKLVTPMKSRASERLVRDLLISRKCSNDAPLSNGNEA